jgi:hypothetical protein
MEDVPTRENAAKAGNVLGIQLLDAESHPSALGRDTHHGTSASRR